jgi:hypothetical protein
MAIMEQFRIVSPELLISEGNLHTKIENLSPDG